MERTEGEEVEDTSFKLWYKGTTTNKNGIGILIYNSLKSGVVDVKRCGDRIILVKMVFGELVLNVICAYGPQVGHSENTMRKYLEDLVRSVPSGEKLFIGGELNGWVHLIEVLWGCMGTLAMALGIKKEKMNKLFSSLQHDRS
jgi:hypothetical protein